MACQCAARAGAAGLQRRVTHQHQASRGAAARRCASGLLVQHASRQRPCWVAGAGPGEEAGSSSVRQAEPVTPPQQQQQAAEEEPVWVRREKQRQLDQQSSELPFGLYLLASVIVAIAAVGSIFEFTNKNAIFGVVTPDNPLWAPILGVFVLTGFPSAGYLFFRAIKAANEAAERMDKMDGY